MTFQEILEGITRHRANRATVSDPEVQRKFEEIEWALMALAEALRDREQEFKDVRNKLDAAFVEMKGHESDAPWDYEGKPNEVDEAFDEYEKRK